MPFISPWDGGKLLPVSKMSYMVSMSTEIIGAKPQTVIVSKTEHPLPAMVERAGAAGRFAWDEFFFAEHHNPHTQKAYLRAVKAFLSWVEG